MDGDHGFKVPGFFSVVDLMDELLECSYFFVRYNICFTLFSSMQETSEAWLSSE